MATVKINGTTLAPQPAFARWDSEIVDGSLDGTDDVGAYMRFTIRAPKLRGQTFNWDDYENQVLTSLQAYAPGDNPDTGADVVYSDGAVAKQIRSFEMPEDRTVSGVEMEIMVIVP